MYLSTKQNARPHNGHKGAQLRCMSSSTCRNLIFIVCFIGTSVAYGQRFSYGVKGGISTFEPEGAGNDESKHYIVGATIEFRLWHGFAVEGDFLYRRNGFNAQFNYGAGVPYGADSTLLSISDRPRFNVFELPVLGKYYFRHDSKVQPFVLTGYTLRKGLVDSNEKFTIQNNSTGKTSTVVFNNSNWTGLDIGASFGTGVRWKVGPVAVAPEVRYTRWGSHPNIGFKKNQADVLLGITF
jgi:hypothetical protein